MKRSEVQAIIQKEVGIAVKGLEIGLSVAAATTVAVEQRKKALAAQEQALLSHPRIKAVLAVAQLEERRKALSPSGGHATHRAGDLLRDALAGGGC